MASITETASGLIPQGSSITLLIIILIAGFLALTVVSLIAFMIWNKKRWNLKVEIKLPRSDGRIINAEWGKGYFNAKQGVVYIKRPGMGQRKIALKIFDPKRYLQGADTLTVIQLSPVDYRPVLPKSFLEYELEYIDEKTGESHTVKETVMQIECDTGASKAWQVSFEAAAKSAYSLQSFFVQFQTPIAIAIVLVAVFVGIAALWTQMPK